MRMTHLPLVAGALAATALAAGAVAAGAGAGAPDQQRGPAIRLVEHPRTFAFVDEPPRGRDGRVSAGDSSVMTSALSAGSGRRPAGSYLAECTALRAGAPARVPFACTGAYRLTGGTISVQGIVVGAEPRIRLAVVGGTGVYEGRTGSVVATARRGSRLVDHALHLQGGAS